MLAGRLPFENNYLLTHMNDRLLKEPTPLRKLEPSITPQMQQIVLRAMDQTHRYRYASAHELAQDLTHMRDVVADESTSHRSYRTTAAWNKNFLLYVLLAAVLVVLFILMMLATRIADGRCAWPELDPGTMAA
jgi:eukaryotic-like serine/threonine-protein kinase